MEQGFPDGTLTDLELRPQLLVAQGCGGSEQIAVDPGTVLVKALKQLDGVHVDPFGTSAGSNPSSVIYPEETPRAELRQFYGQKVTNPTCHTRVLPFMDTILLETKFARIGARLKVADRPSR